MGQATQPIYTEALHGYVAGDDEYTCSVATITPFIFRKDPVGPFELIEEFDFGSCLVTLEQKITIHPESNLPAEKTSILSCGSGENYSSGFDN